MTLGMSIAQQIMESDGFFVACGPPGMLGEVTLQSISLGDFGRLDHHGLVASMMTDYADYVNQCERHDLRPGSIEDFDPDWQFYRMVGE